MSSFSRIVAKNSIFSLMGQVGIKALSFCFSIFVVRRLGGESYGQYTTVLAYVNIFAIVSDLGLAPYGLREIAKDKEKTSSVFSNIVALRLILSLLAVVMVTGSAILSGRSPELVWGIFVYSCGLFLYAIQGPLDVLLMAKERLGYSAVFSVVNQLVFVSLGTIVLLKGYGVIGLIVASLSGVLTMASLSYVVVRSRLGGFQWQVDSGLWLPMVKAALPFGVIGFTLGLSYKVDTVLLQYFWGDAVAGWYNVAYNLIFMLTTISHAMNISLYPSMVRQCAIDPSKMVQIYNRALKYMFVLSFPIAAGTTILADKIVLFLYSEEFSTAILPLRTLIWVLPLMFLSELMGNIVVVHDQEHKVARSIAVSTSVNLIMNLIFIPRFGLTAASAITVVTETILVIQYLWMLRRELASIDRVSAFLKPTLAATSMGAVAWILRGWHVMLVVGIAAVVYLVGIVWLGVVGKQEVGFLRSVFDRREAAVLEEGVSS
jgi:O-antigen/teichoic acid export membrane protein